MKREKREKKVRFHLYEVQEQAMMREVRAMAEG